jgi:hypothetical protein
MVKRILLTIYFCLTTVAIGCAINGFEIQTKIRPEWPGIDLKAKKIYDEYQVLSKLNNIKFDKPITIGFKRINSSSVIGLCHESPRFREIDLDVDFWKYSTSTSKYALLFHELAHCMCGRDHDYAEDKKYPDSQLKRVNWDQILVLKKVSMPGYMEDGCPESIMTPEILSDDCFSTHYDHYTKEMFERCEPW